MICRPVRLILMTIDPAIAGTVGVDVRIGIGTSSTVAVSFVAERRFMLMIVM